MKNNNLPKTITGIIKAINKTTDINTISELENILACHFAAPLMFIGSLLHYCLYYMLLHEEITYVLKDSMFLFLLSLVFILIPYFKFNATIKTHLISLLYSIILIYITIKFYTFMGSSILTLSFIAFSISMARITRTMQIYIGITTFFIGMYIALFLSKMSYDMGSHYYVLQISFFFLLFFIGYMVHTITISRYKRINQLFIKELERSEEMEGLYEEVFATEEELHQQYDQLNANNKQIKLNEETLIHLAHFDSLTDLPNRKMIMDRLSLLIENSSKTPNSFYIAFIDIDNFKKVNDTMGHYIGDMFIKSAAIRLKNSIHESDIIGRIGGDEFALIVERNINEESVYHFIETIRKNFSKPFHIESSVIKSSASIGVAIYPKDGEDIVELIKNADTSMYKAKERGKNVIQFFKSSMKQEMLEKINLENKLLKAYHTHEFYLVFQPIYKLDSMKIRGFEALLRWNSPDLGMVSPEKFIPIAEEMGLIISLGEWVLREASP